MKTIAEIAASKVPVSPFLNYCRSISPSDGAFWAVIKNNDGTEKSRIPLAISERTVRGSISNKLSTKPDGGVDNKEAEKALDPNSANIQRIDHCALPPHLDSFALTFSLAVRNESMAPAGFLDRETAEALRVVADGYARLGGMHYLAERYVAQIGSAAFLWRNRFATDKIVTIEMGDRTWVIAADELGSNQGISITEVAEYTTEGDIATLVTLVAEALAGENRGIFLKIDATGTLAPGFEVFPSQEFPNAEQTANQSKKGSKSKFLSSVDVVARDGSTLRQATMHYQKIGNALRRIDTWHTAVDEFGAIPVEPYGYVQEKATAIRLPGKEGNKGPDFYKLLASVQGIAADLAKATSVATLSPNTHFFFAVLIRGGVFNGDRKTPKTAKAA